MSRCSCVCCDAFRCSLTAGPALSCALCNVSACPACSAELAITCDDDPYTSLVDWLPALFIAVPALVAAGALAWHCLSCHKPGRLPQPRRATAEPLLPGTEPADQGEAAEEEQPPHGDERSSGGSAERLAVERVSRFGTSGSGVSEGDFERADALLVDFFPLETPAARGLLLGTGVLRPERSLSVWWLGWLSWRLLGLALLAFYVGELARADGVRVLLAFDEGWVFLLLFYVPLMLAMVAHMGCAWLYLPFLVTSLPPQTATALRRALRLALGFMMACALGSVALGGALQLTQWARVPRTARLWLATLVEVPRAEWQAWRVCRARLPAPSAGASVGAGAAGRGGGARQKRGSASVARDAAQANAATRGFGWQERCEDGTVWTRDMGRGPRRQRRPADIAHSLSHSLTHSQTHSRTHSSPLTPF